MIIGIRHGNMLELLPQLEAESFSACVCDPPYHLTSIVKRFGSPDAAPAKSNGATGVYARSSKGFMGKTWDGGDVAFQPETWAAVCRVLKPGAHLLAFGGTRTFHRLACAIEDAGFEIRDTIMWLYGSGFPKSHDVSKAIDRAAGAEREVVGINPNYREMQVEASAYNLSRNIDITAPATDAARAWQGWGTALKPACEPIVVARKPLAEGTVAAQVLATGTGAINIDASRVAADGEQFSTPQSDPNNRRGVVGNAWQAASNSERNQKAQRESIERLATLGRWPANVCHDGSPEVLAAFAKFGTSESSIGHRDPNGSMGYHGGASGTPFRLDGHSDAGTAARFFFCAKADASERVGSHPTVKPVALMEWLVRLVTPPGGRVLDPFCGTGSTLVACDRLGLDVLGIEQDAPSIADAEEKIRRMRARRMIGDAQSIPVAEGQLRLL